MERSEVYIAWAKQERTAAILNENNQPIAGATVENLRTGVSVQTDGNGQFSLSLKEGDSLLISYLGYKDPIRTYEGQKEFNLEPESTDLDEVVIVGYGTQIK